MFAGCGEQVLAALQSPGNPAVWETSVAYMMKQSKLVLFSLGDNNFADKTTPVLGVQKRTPKWSPFIQSQFDLLVRATWPPFWGPKTDPKTGVVLSANFLKNSARFDCFRGYATGFAYRWVSMILQRREQFFAAPCKHVCPHMLLNWGGPLWRDRFLLWFLDPKLVPTKITFFHSVKEQEVGKTSEI